MQKLQIAVNHLGNFKWGDKFKYLNKKNAFFL